MTSFLKNTVITGVMGLALFAPAISPVFAQPKGSAAYDLGSQLQAAAGDKGAAIGDPVDPRYVAVFIIRMILGLVGTVMIVLNVYAGYLWMTAGGNEEQVAQAKTTIRNATIGLIIAVASYSITLAVTNLASGNPVSRGSAPQAQPLEGAIQEGIFGN
jgi:amino acid transporter